MKRLLFPCGVLAAGIFATVTALAGPLPKPTELPGYMQTAANLNDPAYLACIKSSTKAPASANLIENYEATLACQKPKT